MPRQKGTLWFPGTLAPNLRIFWTTGQLKFLLGKEKINYSTQLKSCLVLKKSVAWLAHGHILSDSPQIFPRRLSLGVSASKQAHSCWGDQTTGEPARSRVSCRLASSFSRFLQSTQEGAGRCCPAHVPPRAQKALGQNPPFA